MKYSLWGTQGQGGIELAAFDNFDDALINADILKREMSVKIIRNIDDYVYNWDTKKFQVPQHSSTEEERHDRI